MVVLIVVKSTCHPPRSESGSGLGLGLGWMFTGGMGRPRRASRGRAARAAGIFGVPLSGRVIGRLRSARPRSLGRGLLPGVGRVRAATRGR